MYGVSYNTSDGEVKIHQGRCRHTQNQSQNGPVKWENHSNLGDATIAANRHSYRNNTWRYPVCCGKYSGAYFYQCIKCNSLTLGKRFVKKKNLGLLTLFTIGFGFLISVVNGLLIKYGYFDVNYDFSVVGPFLIFIGVLAIPIFYYSHPKKCSNCRTKDFA